MEIEYNMEDGVSIGRKKQAGISFTFDSDLNTEPALYQLWKITGTRGLDAGPACVRRLRNRSWRLLSHSALRGCKVKENSMRDMYEELDVSEHCRDGKSVVSLRESVCQIGSNRETGESGIQATFFEKHDGGVERIGSKRTCAKRKSQLMGKDGLIDSGLENCVDHSQLEKEKGRNQVSGIKELSGKLLKEDGRSHKHQGGQTFFIESSSPLRTALDEVNESNSNVVENETTAIMRKQGSLFENLNTQTGFRRDWYLFGNSSASSTDVSEDGEDGGEDGCNIFSVKGELDEEKSGGDHHVVRENDSERYNDSEWESTSSDDERSSGRRSRSQLSFKKRQSFSKDNSSERISSDLSASGMPIKRSLLSGLFLNEMNRSEGSNSDVKKPGLKRSSTTGLISSDLLASRNNRHQGVSLSERSNLSLLLDTSDHNDFIKEQNFPYDSRDTLFSAKKPLLAKQKSSVGISDFNVISSAARARDDFEIAGGNRNNDLSSSLCKYAKHSSTSSLKSVLSKSNLPTQLSNFFFHKHKPKKQGGSDKSDLDKEDNNHEDISSATSSLVMPRKEDPFLNPALKENSTSDKLSKFRQVCLTPNLENKSVTTELSSSLKESINIDSRLGKVPLPAKVVDEKISDDNLSDNVYYYDYHSRGW